MSKNKVFGIITLIVLVVGAGFLLSRDNSTTPANKEPIVLGALYPLTGGLASFGEASQKSALLAMEEINQGGGVVGRPLQIDFQDHQCNPKTALTIYTQLHDVKNIRVFTSAACTGTVLTLAPLLKDSTLLTATLSGDKVTGVSPNVFRNWASDGLEAKLFAEEIKKNGYKSVAVIYEQTDYAKGLKDVLEKQLLGTDIKIVSEGFASDAADVRTQLTKLSAEKSELWFLSPQTAITGDKILKEMQELNIKPQVLFVNDALSKSTDLVTNYKTFLEGAITGDFVFAKSEKIDTFLKKYQERYGVECKVKNICATAYDNIYMLKAAIEKNGYSGEAVMNYLKTVKFDGVSGMVSFDEKNDRSGAAYSLFTIKDGKTVLK
ncbi:MAG: hypothetical protein A3B90_01945 [Candidatus Magasanikbacteria bacterium RIFCSPHIGHO2_02_FULL_41_13]|uniref:Leucine-binding protein domain-containing protein n=1 Tax=Candidatus Magasanikbacteria bacterium RIFCSPHIGHO2_02_FULL_41_13 TaxID=1798676 RepID=A0A1F6M281_9BACT|nr:MAG: hypothetical protein A3B90_01945 [Candidatus Magasanikbacteria bacterium RIFCSPHIGHO2_02_FULL_41_13]